MVNPYGKVHDCTLPPGYTLGYVHVYMHPPEAVKFFPA
eukprot:SAG22_NODE_1888_length_3374_cov_7.623511_4_plen_37_part_01